MRRDVSHPTALRGKLDTVRGIKGKNAQDSLPAYLQEEEERLSEEDECGRRGRLCPEVYTALNGILFIAEHKKRMEESTKVRSKQSISQPKV